MIHPQHYQPSLSSNYNLPLNLLNNGSFLNADTIVYIQALSNYCKIFLTNGKQIVIAKTLKVTPTLSGVANGTWTINGTTVKTNYLATATTFNTEATVKATFFYYDWHKRNNSRLYRCWNNHFDQTINKI